MSKTLTIDQMAVQLQGRLPMNLTTSYCIQELNKAWRWIEQQGAFAWNLIVATPKMVASTTTITLPSDLDLGKPVYIYAPPYLNYMHIPYKPYDEWVLQQQFVMTQFPGLFACWTYYQTSVGVANAVATFVPVSAAPVIDSNYNVVYHHIVGRPIVSGQYFPTPDAFDDTIVDLAEAEIRRIYHLIRWDTAQTKAQSSAKLMLDAYRSDKKDLRGLMLGAMENQEASLQRSE